MQRFYKARVVKDGTALNSKLNETWFALKGKNLGKVDVKEFRTYLNECATHFLAPGKEEDAPNESTKVSNTSERSTEAGPVKESRKRPAWQG